MMTHFPAYYRYRSGLVMLLLVLASGCGGGLSKPPLPTVDSASALEAAVAYGFDDGLETTEDPHTLVDRARVTPSSEVAELLLSAMAGFIQRGQLTSAQNVMKQLQNTPMTNAQRNRLRHYQAHLAYAQGRHLHAVSLLTQLARAPDLSARVRARLLLLLANSQQALKREHESVLTLLQRDRLLDQPNRIANQQRVLALIDSLDSLDLSLLRARARDDTINGWIALSEISQNSLPHVRADAVKQWRARYANHPVERQLLEKLIVSGGPIHYEQIAVLLPMTSSFNKAAQAFYDGFVAAHNSDRSLRRPTLRLYDIGADPSAVSSHYRNAVGGGADFVVGPLGREAVSMFLAKSKPSLPTLVIGNVPSSRTSPNLFGISLSPEHEAQQVAVRAFADGHRQAGVFRSQSQWGERVANAFTRQWRSLGGVIVADTSFKYGVSDYSRIIRQFLKLDNSNARARTLSKQLNQKLEFAPRRRDDLDFLFLVANDEQARLLAPQLRFFQAHDLALYATSKVYSGKPDPGNDADLDGIVFGDMRWILDASALSGSLNVRPYRHSGLDRLYALGLESYRLIPALQALRDNPWRRHFGQAVDISVAADGNAWRHLAWARFEGGLPVRLPYADAVFVPSK